MVRSGPLSDPQIRRTIADHFVPVVFDLCQTMPYRVPDDRPFAQLAPSASNESGLLDEREVAAFFAVQQQEPLIKGIWITTPDGTVLSSSQQGSASAMLALLQATIVNWQGQSGGPPLPLNDAPPGSTACTTGDEFSLVIHGRLVDGTVHEPFRDLIGLTQDECRQFMPSRLRVGESVAVPVDIMRRIVTRFYAGEMRLALNRDEVRDVSANVTINRVAAGTADAELNGSLDVDGVWVGRGRRRLYRASLLGRVRWDIERNHPIELEIVSDGTWQAEYPEGFRPGTDIDNYPGGPSGRLVMSLPMRLLFVAKLTSSTSPGLE